MSDLTQQQPQIPRNFHFVFGLKPQYERFHLVYFLCLKSCIEINKPDTLFFYYHFKPYGPLWDLIAPYLTLVKVPLVPKAFTENVSHKASKQYQYAHLADFVRLEQLIEKGGIYADIDTIFVRPLPDYLFKEAAVIGLEADVINDVTGEVKKSVCNAFLLAKANAIFMKTWLEKMPNAFDGSWSNHSCQLPYELSQELSNEVKVLPEQAFFYIAPTSKDLALLFNKQIQLPDDTYNLHLWSHLWWSPFRKDFSDVSNLDFTISKLKSRSTTYSELAKPFLPSLTFKQLFKISHLVKDLRGLIGKLFINIKNISLKALRVTKRILVKSQATAP